MRKLRLSTNFVKDGVPCNGMVFVWAPDEKQRFLVPGYMITTVACLPDRLRPKAMAQLFEIIGAKESLVVHGQGPMWVLNTRSFNRFFSLP